MDLDLVQAEVAVGNDIEGVDISWDLGVFLILCCCAVLDGFIKSRKSRDGKWSRYFLPYLSSRLMWPTKSHQMSSSRHNGEEARDESQARRWGSDAECMISLMINDLVNSLVRPHPSINEFHIQVFTKGPLLFEETISFSFWKATFVDQFFFFSFFLLPYKDRATKISATYVVGVAILGKPNQSFWRSHFVLSK